MFTAAESKEKVIEHDAIACDLLAQAGFIVSVDKRAGPSQSLVHLGLTVCSVNMKFFIPEKKIVRIIEGAQNLIKSHNLSRSVPIKQLASWLGLLQSVWRAVGSLVRLFSRRAYSNLSTAVITFGWSGFMALDSFIVQELTFWSENLRTLSGFNIDPKRSETAVTCEIVSDSSSVGCMVLMLDKLSQKVLIRKKFTNFQSKSSSTFRELLALHFLYYSDEIVQFSGTKIRHLVDNKAVTSIIYNGSNKPQLQLMAEQIALNCRKHDVKLIVTWVSRENQYLQIADTGSKSFDKNNFSLNFHSFSVIIDFFP